MRRVISDYLGPGINGTYACCHLLHLLLVVEVLLLERLVCSLERFLGGLELRELRLKSVLGVLELLDVCATHWMKPEKVSVMVPGRGGHPQRVVGLRVGALGSGPCHLLPPFEGLRGGGGPVRGGAHLVDGTRDELVLQTESGEFAYRGAPLLPTTGVFCA